MHYHITGSPAARHHHACDTSTSPRRMRSIHRASNSRLDNDGAYSVVILLCVACETCEIASTTPSKLYFTTISGNGKVRVRKVWYVQLRRNAIRTYATILQR